ncbi:MAG: hypothetical protein HYU99_00830 [Deltaproteobacteria bacterium]|nr:hypothetical protein [Deltaproteobacteria bacterium]
MALINQTAEEDFDLLKEFTGYYSPANGLNSVVNRLPSAKVLALKNQRLLSWAVEKVMVEAVIERRGYYADDDMWPGPAETLRRFVIYNPGIETLKAMIAVFPLEAMRNHLNWLVNHIPKGSNTRDTRRDIAEFMLVTLRMGDLPDHRYGSKEIGDFLNAVIPSIDRNQPNRSDRNDTVLAFARFSRMLANIQRVLSELPLHELTTQIALWRTACGKKEFLNAANFREMGERLDQMVLDYFFAACKLPVRLQRKIRATYADPESVLRKDNLFLTLMGYYFFQTEIGKEIVIRYLAALVKDKKLKKEGLKPGRAVASLKIGGEQLSGQFLEILHSILEHLGVEKSGEIENDRLKAVVQNIEITLRLGKPIPVDRLDGWKKEIGALEVNADYPHIGEILHNIDQIAKTQAGGGSRQVETADFELTISDSLADIALAGEYPLRTCQRLSAAGDFNSDGEPVARALHPSIFVANLRNTATGEIVGRTILENSRSGRRPPGKFLLLVERRYLVGDVSRHDFDLLLLRQLVNQEGVDDVVFANATVNGAVMGVVGVGNLPGGIYRDTFRSGKKYETHLAIDITKLKAIWARNPQFDPLNPESDPNPDIIGGEGDTEDHEPMIDELSEKKAGPPPAALRPVFPGTLSAGVVPDPVIASGMNSGPLATGLELYSGGMAAPWCAPLIPSVNLSVPLGAIVATAPAFTPVFAPIFEAQPFMPVMAFSVPL